MAASIRKIENDTELNRILNRDSVLPSRTGYVEVGEDNFILPIIYQKYEEKLRKFEIRNDDVFVTGHPKTGTTWAQEMIWLIVNNLDYEGAKVRMDKRCHLLEIAALFDFDIITKENEQYINTRDFLTLIAEAESPRCIKSHLHWSLLPEQIRNGSKTPKIITLLRNAKDTCVSMYYHKRLIGTYKGNFENFCELFLAGRVIYGPFWKLVLSYWQERNRPNILFIKYKDMKEDLPSVIKKVAEFLGKTMTEEEIKILSEYLDFNSMKKNVATNQEQAIKLAAKAGIFGQSTDGSFVRSGKMGEYKSAMSSDLIERFDAWTKENTAGTGISTE